MKKVNLCFDATILCNVLNKNSGRSGIFFTAYNLAKEFYNNKSVNLMFYCNPERIHILKKSFNHELTEFKDIEIINDKPLQCFVQNNYLDLFNSSSVSGIYNKESNGSWTSDTLSLKFFVPQKTQKLTIDISTTRYFKTVKAVTVFNKDNKKILSQKTLNKHILITVSGQDISKDGLVEILLKVEGASSPQTKDKRILGMMIKSIYIKLDDSTQTQAFLRSNITDKRIFLENKIYKSKVEKKSIKKKFFKALYLLCSPFKNEHEQLNNVDFDAYFSPQMIVPPVINSLKHVKKYTLVHDTIPLLFPQYMHQHSIDWVNKLIKSMNKDDYYFANSENTRKDFLHFAEKIDPQKFYVAPLAAGDNFYKASKKQIVKALKKYNLPLNKKYVFCLCTCDPRKNQIRAIKTFITFIKKYKIDDLVFVLGGGHWEHFIGELNKSISDLGKYKNKIIRAGYIDDEDLAPLYSGAQWFVYTSQYEGFGLPPLEAMKCACPVITSNNSSLPEVVGNSAIKIDWDNDKQHIAAYKKYYFDETYRKEMAQKGLKRSQNFSWKKCANIIVKEMKNNV